MTVHISAKGLTVRIQEESHSSLREKQLNKKWAEDLNRYFTKEEIQIWPTYIESCLASPLTAENRV